MKIKSYLQVCMCTKIFYRNKSTNRSHDQRFLPVIVLSELASLVGLSANVMPWFFCTERAAHGQTIHLWRAGSVWPQIALTSAGLIALHLSELANCAGQFWQMVKAPIQKSLNLDDYLSWCPIIPENSPSQYYIHHINIGWLRPVSELWSSLFHKTWYSFNWIHLNHK